MRRIPEGYWKLTNWTRILPHPPDFCQKFLFLVAGLAQSGRSRPGPGLERGDHVFAVGRATGEASWRRRAGGIGRGGGRDAEARILYLRAEYAAFGTREVRDSDGGSYESSAGTSITTGLLSGSQN